MSSHFIFLNKRYQWTVITILIETWKKVIW